VLLSWEARGERAELSWYNHHGQSEGWREVGLSGSTTVKLRDKDPVADHWVDFKLYVVRESGVYTYTERRLRVTLVCRLGWFFSPPPEGCPSEAANRISLIGQRFEGGVVLGDATRARVYLDERGQPYVSLGLRLLPQEDLTDAAPPAGLFLPAPEFSGVWAGLLPGQEDLRGRLGWATGPAVTFDSARQCAQADLGDEAPSAGLFLPAPEFSGVWAGLLPGNEDLRDRLGWATGPAVAFNSARQCAQAEQGGPPRDCFQLGLEGRVYHARMVGEPQAIWLDDKWPLSYSRGTWELWPVAELDD
jgi:hypothetical protein